jgi:hypothetical protein
MHSTNLVRTVRVRWMKVLHHHFTGVTYVPSGSTVVDNVELQEYGKIEDYPILATSTK